MPTPDEVAFEEALRRVFQLEGGLSDHAADRGGTTKFGISLRYLQGKGAGGGGDLDLDGDVDAADILALKPEHARRFYRSDFWEPSGAADVAFHSQLVAAKLFEFAVVAGPRTAVKVLQKALIDVGQSVVADGIFGSLTKTAVSRATLGRGAPELLLALRRRCAEHFLNILASDKSQLAFAVGWMRRALDLDRGA